MFVRTEKTPTGLVRYALVENRRVGGKTRQRMLYYLGSWKTAEAYLTRLDRRAREPGRWGAEEAAAEAARLRGILAGGGKPKGGRE